MGFFSCFFYNLFVYCCCFPNIIHLDQLCINCYIECETEVCGFTGIPWGGGGGGSVVVRTGTFFIVPVLFRIFRDQLLYGTFRTINVHCDQTKSLQELLINVFILL